MHYNLMARVTPSPTVSMFRLIRASLYSFLFSLSMATVSASSGDGFSTFPPHSTCSTRHIFIEVLPLELARCKNLCVSCFFFGCSAYIVDSNDTSFSQQLQRLLVVVVIVNFVSIDEDEVKCFCLARRQEII